MYLKLLKAKNFNLKMGKLRLVRDIKEHMLNLTLKKITQFFFKVYEICVLI
jgi:hypothetical protein